MPDVIVHLPPIKFPYGDGWAEPDGEGGLYIPNRFIKRLLRPRQLAWATADAWQIYNSFIEYEGDGTIDLDDHTFKMQLHSSSYTYAATHSVRADLTNELSTANGYTAGGTALTTTWTRSGGTATFNISGGASWTASGGSIVARRAVIYDDTPSSPLDPLVASALLDNSPADLTATNGNAFSVTASTGVYTKASA